MTKIDKEIIMEDLDFICDYIADMMKRHDLCEIEVETVKKLDRRMNDILRRLDVE